METIHNYSIKGLLNTDVEQMQAMSTEDLVDMVRGLVNKTRRRARGIEVHNMEKYDIPYQKLMQSGGYSYNPNKYRKNKDGSINRRDLISDALRYQKYLEAQTSTYSGLMKWDKNVTESFGKSLENKAKLAEQQAKNAINPFDNSITPEAQALYDKAAMLRAQAEDRRQMYSDLSWEQKAEYWKLVDEIKENGEYSTFWGSDQVQGNIIDWITTGNNWEDMTFSERIEELKKYLGQKKTEALHQFH